MRVRSVIIALLTVAAVAKAQTPPVAPATPPRFPSGPAPLPIPATGIMNTYDIVAIATLVARAVNEKAGEESSLKYVGRVAQFTTDPIDLTSIYDQANHRLTVSTSAKSEGFVLSRTLTHWTYYGSDVYGTQTSADKIVGDTYGVAADGNAATPRIFTYAADMDSGAAQALRAAIRLRLTGTIGRATGFYAKAGTVLEEHPRFVAATATAPIETSITSHNLVVDFTKIEWIDSRTHLVIATKNLP